MSEAILPTSCPKPAQREKAAKRNGIQRKTPMQRSKPKPMGAMPQRQSKPRKPLAKVNVERLAKRRKSYAQKLAAYKRSATYKIVEARAAGQCEAFNEWYSQMHDRDLRARCGCSRARGDRLTHHHKTYARFGWGELPEDIIVLCDHHNAEAESKHPTRNRNYRSSHVPAREGVEG